MSYTENSQFMKCRSGIKLTTGVLKNVKTIEKGMKLSLFKIELKSVSLKKSQLLLKAAHVIRLKKTNL